MTRHPIVAVLVILALSIGCSDGRGDTAADVGSEPAGTTAVESTTPTSTTSTTTSTSTTTTTTTVAPPVIQSDLQLTYRPEPVRPGNLLVHDGSTVAVVDLDTDPVVPRVVFGPVDGLIVLAARLASDGSLVIELADDATAEPPDAIHKIVQLGTDGSIVDLIDGATLFDVAEFGGVEQVLVGATLEGDAEESSLVAVPLDGRPPVAFGLAFGPEYAVNSIDVVDGVAVVSAYSDLTERVFYTDPEGNEVVRPSPTDGLDYGVEPAVSHATFSPDGSAVAWIEGPEYYLDVESDELTWHGEWRVRIADAITGEERLSWPFEFPDSDRFGHVITGLTHTGERLVISRAVVRDGPLSQLDLLVVDLAAEEPTMFEPAIRGAADVVG